MKFFSKLMDGAMRILAWFLIGILAVMTVVLFLSVVSRYFLDFSLPWSDPLARYGQTWIMLLGSALVLRKGLHIGIDNFVNKIPPKFRQIVLKVNVVLILIFSCTMTWQGVRLIGIAQNQIIPEMGLPMAIIYYMIPISGVLFILTCVEMLFRPRIDSLSAKE